MKTAKELKRLDGFTGDARLFKLSEPICYDSDEKIKTGFVVVSATNVSYSGPETYIFPANKDGEILSWSELHGSFRGSLDHEAALRGAGYEVA